MKGSENRRGDFLYGYATRGFEVLEDLAGDMARASTLDRDKAIRAYCKALNSAAQERSRSKTATRPKTVKRKTRR